MGATASVPADGLTFALLTVAPSCVQWRFPRSRSLVIEQGRPLEDAMRRQRLAVAEDDQSGASEKRPQG